MKVEGQGASCGRAHDGELVIATTDFGGVHARAAWPARPAVRVVLARADVHDLGASWLQSERILRQLNRHLGGEGRPRALSRSV